MTAAELCSDLVLAEDSRALLREEMGPLDFVDALAASQHYQEAVTVLSRAVPVRERIWWACCCARQCSDFDSAPAIASAVQAAEAWVTDGSEASRYRAFEAAQLVRLGSAANCVAMAAFASVGSMAPANAELMPPPPQLSAQLAAGAVIVASIGEGAEHAAERYAFFIEQGKQFCQSATAPGAA